MKNKAPTQGPDMQAIEKALAGVCNRLSGAEAKKPGAIVLRFTDLGEERCLDGSADAFRVAKAPGAAPPLVRVSGPSWVLSAIMSGEKEASRAFVAGGIRVSGDLRYLEALLEELGMLNCQ